MARDRQTTKKVPLRGKGRPGQDDPAVQWVDRGGYQPPTSSEGPKNPPKYPSPIQTAPPQPKGKP